MCTHASLQDGVYCKGLWIEHLLTSLPFDLQGAFLCMCGHGSLLTLRMRNIWPGQGPASSLNGLAMLIWKDPDTGKDWRWEKGMTEDEMVGWYHRLNGHEWVLWELMMEREAWHAAVHGVAESDWTELMLILEFQSKGNKSPVALPWPTGRGGWSIYFLAQYNRFQYEQMQVNIL